MNATVPHAGTNRLRVLLLEDSVTDAEFAIRALRTGGYEPQVRHVMTEAAFTEALDHEVDLILADYRLPSYDGLAALRLVRARGLVTPFIVVSGALGDELAAQCIKEGANDYVLKGRLSRLAHSVKLALEEHRLRLEAARAQAALVDGERRYRELVEALPAAVYTCDADGRIVLFNEAAVELLGRTPMPGKDLYCGSWKILAADGSALPLDKYPVAVTLRRGQASRGREIVVERPDGSRRNVLPHPQLLRDAAGAVVGAVNMLVDITALKEQEFRLLRLNRVRVMMSAVNATIVRASDRKSLFREACRIAVELGGFASAWISEFDPVTLDVTAVAWSGGDTVAPAAAMKVTARADVPLGLGVSGRAIREKTAIVCNDLEAESELGGPRRIEAIRQGFRSQIGLPLLVEDTVWGTMSLYAREANFFTDEEVVLLRELAADIAFALDHIGKGERLDYLDYYDALTDLPNRTLFADRLAQHLRAAGHRETGAALVLVDLERFRIINNSLGREAADRVLRLVAQRLRDVLPDRDSVARLHGDVFAVLLPVVSDATEVAHVMDERILGCLAQPIAVEGQTLRLTAKAGAAMFPGDATTHDALLGNAEAALRNAKSSPERYLFFAPKMNAQVAERVALENKLRVAVDRDEFILYYQPKFSLRERRITGLEALLRWNDPDRGLVLPGNFIGLLEETGLIADVGAWAMRQAVAQFSAWRAAGWRPPHISVNLSQVQLKRADFLATVERAIAVAGDAEHGLDLEITESMIMEDIDENVAKLLAVKALGVDIAIDDFGTGYSSLQYIARLPISALKIDRGFVRNIIAEATDMTMVSAIISLSHNLGLRVIAEGVETEEQAKFLRLLNCDEVQGFLFGRPEPAERVESLFLNPPAAG